MPWSETPSARFVARHELTDADDAAVVLDQLERAADSYAVRLGVQVPPDLAVVLHGSQAQLDVAQPWLPVHRRMTAPAARRYLVGWAGAAELHVLAPRLLAQRALNAQGSLELLMLIPSALLAKRLLAEATPTLPPPFTARSFARYLRWAWLVEGAAQWLSGQWPHARPAVRRRLVEGPPPAFPPGRADATLLGGSVFDLVAREEGTDAAIALALEGPRRRSPEEALVDAFHGRPLRHTEGTWRALLARDAPARRRAR